MTRKSNKKHLKIKTKEAVCQSAKNKNLKDLQTEEVKKLKSKIKLS